MFIYFCISKINHQFTPKCCFVQSSVNPKQTTNKQTTQTQSQFNQFIPDKLTYTNLPIIYLHIKTFQSVYRTILGLIKNTLLL